MELQANRTRALTTAVGAEISGALRHLTNFLPELTGQDRRRKFVLLVWARAVLGEIRACG